MKNWLILALTFIMPFVVPVTAMAQNTPVSLTLSPASLTKQVNDTFSVQVGINAGSYDISGADIQINFNNVVLEMQSFQPSSTFNDVVIPGTPDNANGRLRFVVTTTSTTPVTGNLILGTIQFRAKTQGTGQVTFGPNEIVASGFRQAIPTANNTTGNYIIGTGGNTNPNAVSLNLSPATANKNVNETFDVTLSIAAGNFDISGADITFNYDKAVLEMVSFQPSSVLNPVIQPAPNNNTGIYRYVGVSTSTTPNNGNVNVGTIRFKGKAQGTGQVTFGSHEITASGQSSALTTNNTTGSYTIGTTTQPPPPPPPPPPAGPPPPPPPVIPNCNQTGNVKFRLNSAQSWTTSGNVPINKPVFIAGFRNNDTTTLPRDITLSVEYNFNPVEIPPGNNVSFIPTQPGEYVIRATTAGQSGNDCLILHVSGKNNTQKVRIAETKLGLDKTEEFKEFDYVDQPLDVEYALKDKNPGLKTIWLKFFGTNDSGEAVDRTEGPFKITVLGPDPKISSLSCSIILTGGVSFEIKGANFGATAGRNGKVKVSDTTLKIDKWSDGLISGTLNQQATNGQSFPVVLTRNDGEVTEEATCTIGVSQIELGANRFCSQAQAISNVEVILAEGKTGGTVLKQIVTINTDGTISNLKGIQEGQGYKLGIKAPKSLRKVVEFIAQKGTTEVGPLNLPIGDISPVNGDGKINSNDYSELVREWVIAQPGGERSGDLNGDNRVNSFDWACMRPYFNPSGQEDAIPTAGPLKPATSSEGSTTATATATPSPSPAATASPSVSQNSTLQNVVQIKNFSFSPDALTVKVGDKLKWTNQDSVGHSATADDNSFDTGVFGQSESKAVSFSKAGTYTYHCSVHPEMHGTIVVQ